MPKTSKIHVDPALYINRELSWLSFNERVLHEASRPDVPLLERLKFLAIVSNNLDEFFMVRVAGLRHSQRYRKSDISPDGLTPTEQLTAVTDAARRQVERQYRLLREELFPELGERGARILPVAELSAEEREVAEDYYERMVFPVLTPMAVDPSHPFPWIPNLALNLAVDVSRGRRGRRLVIIQVPRRLSRLIPVGDDAEFVLLEELMVARLAGLFPGCKVRDWALFRFTRDGELEVDPESVHDFREAMESEIKRRKRSGVVRLEALAGQGDALVKRLATKVRLKENGVYRVDGPLDLRLLFELADQDKVKAPTYPRFSPAERPELLEGPPWKVLRGGDVLLHHPYESYEPVENFISQAADDPDVLAIKMTLYRTGGESAIMDALLRAAEHDKQVTVLVELLARFDEERNLEWSQRLERAGANVIYGVAGLKTHAKIALVVRREASRIRRYLHLGTGNYNPRTARIYTDLSLFTADEDFGFDGSSFFNSLTGFSDPPEMRRLIMAPLHIRDRLMSLIEREADHARAGAPAEIAIKVNSLVDARMIAALYDAAKAGVEINLIIRGICCLRPGVEGVSERIRVLSVIGRFLEHTRIYYFRNAGHDEVFLSSADMMPRNLDRRVELLFPVLSEPLRERIRAILGAYLRDNTRAWELQADGTYVEVEGRPSDPEFRAQHHFQEEGRRASGVERDAAHLQFRPRVRR